MGSGSGTGVTVGVPDRSVQGRCLDTPCVHALGVENDGHKEAQGAGTGQVLLVWSQPERKKQSDSTGAREKNNERDGLYACTETDVPTLR